MPRKGPAPKHPVVIDPVYNSPLVTSLVNKVSWTASAPPPSASSTAPSRAAARRPARPGDTLKRALDNVKPTLEVKSRASAVRTYQVRSRSAPAQHHAGAALVGLVLRGPPREDDDRASDERAAGCLQRSGSLRQAARGHHKMRSQQGVRPLPLVTQPATRLESS